MRIYLPSTVAGLRAWLAAGELTPIGGIAFGVTPSLRAEYEGADQEEYEYLAMRDAAVASLRLIAAERVGIASVEPADAVPPADPWSGSMFPALRVVVAADVQSAGERPDLDRAAVQVPGAVPWSAVAAVHVDSAEAVPVVLAAAAVVDAADLGDPDAEFILGEAEDVELCWYHPSEVSFLISELGG